MLPAQAHPVWQNMLQAGVIIQKSWILKQITAFLSFHTLFPPLPTRWGKDIGILDGMFLNNKNLGI